MKFRKLGRTGVEVSEIGMGLEHLLDKDQQAVTNTIRAAISGGVNYFDCHPGDSYDKVMFDGVYEGYIKLGRAIRSDRNKVCLSYIAHCQAREPEKACVLFENYLKALGTDYTDVFIIQFCDKMTDYEQVIGDGGLLSYAQRLKSQGRVRFIGISTHSSAVASEAINSGCFDVLMFPVNPAFDVITDEERYKTEDLGTLWDAAYEFTTPDRIERMPRKNVYNLCQEKGVGLVAMKPFAGGFIFGVEKNAGFTPVNLVSYALAQNGVSTVVPGCTEPREIEEILTYNNCGDKERDYSGAVAGSRWSVMGNCLYCNHCLPCDAGVNVGQINKLLDALLHNPAGDSDVREQYRALAVKASDCVRCGACMKRCPFKVDVINRMEQAAKVFENSDQ